MIDEIKRIIKTSEILKYVANAQGIHGAHELMAIQGR